MKNNILKRGILPAFTLLYAATEAGAAPAEEPAKPVFVVPKVPSKKTKETIEIKKLVTTHGTQPRVATNPEVIAEYHDLIKQAKADGKDYPMPPVQCVRTPEGKMILWDGFQRIEANKGLHSEIEIEYIDGDEDLAVYLSLSANSAHGAQRTSKDKRNALKRAFEIPGVENLSDAVVAEMCAVSPTLVRVHRPAMKQGAVRTSKKGHAIKTSNIGKTPKGKGKKAKPAKKDKKAAAKPDSGKKAEESKAKTMELIQKIEKNIGGAEGAKIRAAIVDGSLPLTTRDLQDFAGLSPETSKKIAPLVASNRMKPWKAFEFSKEALDERAVEKCHLYALARGGEGVHEDEKLGIKIVVTLTKKK